MNTLIIYKDLRYRPVNLSIWIFKNQNSKCQCIIDVLLTQKRQENMWVDLYAKKQSDLQMSLLNVFELLSFCVAPDIM